MAKKKKKILLLLAGGTCILDKQGQIFSIRTKKDIEAWLELMPELNILADIETVLISGEDQLASPEIWQKISKEILAKEKIADGFVIVSKIDQLINTALAINFLLQNFKQTIIFTSSQVSGSGFVDKKEILNKLKNKHGGLGLRTNLINAIQIASEPLPGPAIISGARLIPAAKAVYDSLDEMNNFISIDAKYWAKIDFGINLQSSLKYSSKKEEPYTSMSAKVLLLEDLPGTDWNFNKQDLAGYDGLFIKVLPFQALDDNKQQKINEWKLPTVIYNYQSAVPVKGAIVMTGCSANAALIKTIWALSNKTKLAKFEDTMRQNIIGEFKE